MGAHSSLFLGGQTNSFPSQKIENCENRRIVHCSGFFCAPTAKLSCFLHSFLVTLTLQNGLNTWRHHFSCQSTWGCIFIARQNMFSFFRFDTFNCFCLLPILFPRCFCCSLLSLVLSDRWHCDATVFNQYIYICCILLVQRPSVV